MSEDTDSRCHLENSLVSGSRPQPSEPTPDVAAQESDLQIAPAEEIVNEDMASPSRSPEEIRAEYEASQASDRRVRQILATYLENVRREKAEEQRRAEIAKQKSECEVKMAKDPEYEDYEEEEQDYENEEDDSRPQPITAKDIARIDRMSPDELNSFIEDIDAHEEWEELRRDAKQRIESWRSGLKKADEAPRCAHTKPNGKGCGSPALKDESLCYFHSLARSQAEVAPANSTLEMISLEDRLGVQLAIMRVCTMLADKTLDAKTGRAVLAGLRLAQRNLGNANAIYGGLNDPK